MSWIVGDIHGCIDELEELLEMIPPKDPLIFVGDYIDRGPNSFQVIERLIKEKKRSVFLKGNHEVMFLSHFKSPLNTKIPASAFLLNGGKLTLDSYGLKESVHDIKKLPARHIDFYMNLVNYYESKDFLVVHAGVRADLGPDIKNQNEDDLHWIRMDWLKSEHKWTGKRVYFGHTPSLYIYGIKDQTKPIFGEKSLGIDTGCVYGGYLSAINSKTDKLIQVKAKTNYVVP